MSASALKGDDWADTIPYHVKQQVPVKVWSSTCPLSTSSRGLGFAVHFAYRHMCANSMSRCSVHQLYRVSLAQFTLQLSEANRDVLCHLPAKWVPVAMATDEVRILHDSPVNLSPVANLVNSVGSFCYGGVDYAPVQFDLMPWYMRLNYANLRLFVKLMSNPTTPLSQRLDVYKHNPIPGVDWGSDPDNPVLQNPDDIMPAEYKDLAVDVEAVIALIRSLPDEYCGLVHLNGRGSYSQIPGVLNFNVALPKPGCEVTDAMDLMMYSNVSVPAHALTHAAFLMVGESVSDEDGVQPEWVTRHVISSVSCAHIEYNWMSGHSCGALQDSLMDWVDEEDREEGDNEEVDVLPMVDQLDPPLPPLPPLPPNDGEADTPQAGTDLPRDWSLEPDCLDTAEGEDKSSWIRCFAVSDGFDLVAAGTACGKVVVWRADTGKLVHSFHLMRRVVSVCFIGTEYLAVGCTGMSLEVWQQDASGKWTIEKWKTNLKFQPTALSASSSLRLLACFAFLHYRLVVFKSGTGEELYRESGEPQHMLVKIQLVDNVTSIHLVLSVDNTLQVLTWPHRPFGGDVRLTVPTTREFHRGPGFNGFAVHGNYLTYCVQEDHRHPCFTTVDLLSGAEKRIMIPWTRNGKLLSVLGHNLLLGVTGSWNLEHRKIWAADMKSGAKVMDIPCPGVDSRYTEVLGDAWDGHDWCDGHMLLCHIRSKETVLRVVRLRRRQHGSGENQSAALDCVPAAIAE